MELFIQIRDGQPHEHPIMGDNFREAFPLVDINNLPSNFAKFERVQQPNLGPYQTYLGVTYEWIDGVVKDAHHVQEMTPQEKAAKQQATKDAWAQGPNFASWEFDQERCAYISPTPYPDDGKRYTWNEPTTSWIEVI